MSAAEPKDRIHGLRARFATPSFQKSHAAALDCPWTRNVSPQVIRRRTATGVMVDPDTSRRVASWSWKPASMAAVSEKLAAPPA